MQRVDQESVKLHTLSNVRYKEVLIKTIEGICVWDHACDLAIQICETLNSIHDSNLRDDTLFQAFHEQEKRNPAIHGQIQAIATVLTKRVKREVSCCCVELYAYAGFGVWEIKHRYADI